jgi:hypothetical protein
MFASGKNYMAFNFRDGVFVKSPETAQSSTHGRDQATVDPWQQPSRVSSAIFAAKVITLRLKRRAKNLASGCPRLRKMEYGVFRAIVAESRTALRTDAALAEVGLQTGKIENLRVACRTLHGTVIPAGAEFSVWRQLGPPISSRGYVPGRMLQQGCMVPAVGGGLCQLSNALYDVALQAGCRIIERHAHSKIIPGSAAAFGRDATIAWNYVDLRFSPLHDVQLYTKLDVDSLIVRLLHRSGELAKSAPVSEHEDRLVPALVTPRDCHSCNQSTCFRRSPSPQSLRSDQQAFLVDENWPEFQKYIQAARGMDDRFGIPINGARLGLSRYTWSMERTNSVTSAPIAGFMRATALRLGAPSGPARRNKELAGSERIAKSLARLLTPDIRAVTVAQSYLPFLYRDGFLGGREVSVLMSRLPMAALHARLYKAAAAHPDRASLADFRASDWLMAAETEALADATHIITPHAEIAALFPGRAIRLPWQIPEISRQNFRSGSHIVFPGPTIARKGAFAVRNAAIALGLEVVPLGSELEGPNFWAPARVTKWRGWDDTIAVVQPSLVEDQPRVLLMALARGIPVIATSACGLPAQNGLTVIPPDDPSALTCELARLIATSTFPGLASAAAP